MRSGDSHLSLPGSQEKPAARALYQAQPSGVGWARMKKEQQHNAAQLRRDPL